MSSLCLSGIVSSVNQWAVIAVSAFSDVSYSHCSESFPCPLSFHALFHHTDQRGGQRWWRRLSPVSPCRRGPSFTQGLKQPGERQASGLKSGSRFPWSTLLKLVLPFLYTRARRTKHFISEQMECQVKWCGGGIQFCRDKINKIRSRAVCLIFYFLSVFFGSASEPKSQFFLQPLHWGGIQMQQQPYHFNLSLWFRGGSGNFCDVCRCLNAILKSVIETWVFDCLLFVHRLIA